MAFGLTGITYIILISIKLKKFKITVASLFNNFKMNIIIRKTLSISMHERVLYYLMST
jgi:hypothetical protein